MTVAAGIDDVVPEIVCCDAAEDGFGVDVGTPVITESASVVAAV